ncbi:MAG: hypothetical protein ABI333_10915 [bacterium]
MKRDFSEHSAVLWDQIAKELEGDFLETKEWVSSRLVATDGEWRVALDYHQHPGYRSTAIYTRFHAPYMSENPFRFRLRYEHFEHKLGKLVGLQDIEVGDKKFDKTFLIQSNQTNRFTTILNRKRLRELLQAEPHVRLLLHDDLGFWGEHYDKPTRDVSIELHGRIKDVERLKRLYDTLAEVMTGLCETRGETE